MTTLNDIIPDRLGEIAHLIIVLGIFTLIFGIAELWHVLFNPPAEYTRKFIHVSCGIIMACFHWFFSSDWPVIVMGSIISILMVLARIFKKFPWLFGVKRRSHGELYYIFAIIALFIISHQHPIYYFISVMILTISDPLAALIGSHYHRMSYVVEYHHKSLEGSFSFFIATFIMMSISLWLLLDIPPAHSLLIAIPIALILTCLEAISLNGIDNILIPLGTYLLLHQFVPMPSHNIVHLLILEVAILTLCLIISWNFHPFTFSGAIVLHFYFFGALILDDWIWLVTPLIAISFTLFLFTYIYKTSQSQLFKASRVVAIFYIILVPFIILWSHFLITKYPSSIISEKLQNHLYPLYVGAISGQLTITLWRILKLYTVQNREDVQKSIFLLTLGSIILIIPLGLAIHFQALTGTNIAEAVTTAIFIPLIYRYIWHPTTQFHWEFRLQMCSTALGTLLVLAYYLIG